MHNFFLNDNPYENLTMQTVEGTYRGDQWRSSL